jgi:uncharacterized metal-binding protein
MTLACADCATFVCRVGHPEAAPDTCPMRGPFPDFDTLYPPGPVRRLAYHSAVVEGVGYRRWTRLREVVELAHRMEYPRVGIAHCADTGREAGLAAARLAAAALDVVVPPGSDDCDPVAQAHYLRDRKTQLNVIVGMCVGHDALFLRHATAPVTSLVVRDARLGHNPMAALYTRAGYLKHAVEPRVPWSDGAFAGWSDARLDRLAREVRVSAATTGETRCRLGEIMDFARLGGARHLGLVFCVGLRQEAHDLAELLQRHGFRVSSVCCKTGSVPKERLGIQEAEKVRPGTAEVICNPLAQADLLEREGVQLVLLLGQCVGHDAATVTRLRTPAVFVAAKDRVLAHNTVAALQTP